jgi:hypothetical protein
LEGLVEFGDIVAVDDDCVEAETFQTNPEIKIVTQIATILLNVNEKSYFESKKLL